MNEKLTLIFHIERSQLAYSLYVKEKRFFQALRIYKANKEIYSLLNRCAYLWNDSIRSTIFEYLFHLEDWFEQFDNLRSSRSFNLDDEFVFGRLSSSIPYPSAIIDVISKIN
jgi:hypothetical protein